MPPKRKPPQPPVLKLVKKSRTQGSKNPTKMAAHQLNVAELRALLQAALEQQGASVDSSGYAYVSVPDRVEDSSILESQDPLADSSAAESKGPIVVSQDSLAGTSGDCAIAPVQEECIEYSVSVPMDRAEESAVLGTNEPLADLFTAAPETEAQRSITVVSQDPLGVLDDNSESVPGESESDLNNTSEIATTSKPIQNDALVTFLHHSPLLGDENFDQMDSQDILNGDNKELDVIDKQMSEIPPKTGPTSEGPGDVIDWEQKYKQLKERFKNQSEHLKKTKKKYAQLEKAKLSTDDYALRISKELQELKDQQKIPQAKFTEEEGITITVQEMEELNERSTSDSMFVGLLVTHLIGADKLRSMSVTGQPSHRFAKLKKSDGSPRYPASEKLDPKILDFICNKVAERVAKQVGPAKVKTIRQLSESGIVKRYIAQKIGNLKKAAVSRQARETGPKVTDENRDGNIGL